MNHQLIINIMENKKLRVLILEDSKDDYVLLLRELNKGNYAAIAQATITSPHIPACLLKMWLREQPEVGVALLSGSGSTVFAVLRDEADGEALAARVREKIDSHIWTHACETQAA